MVQVDELECGCCYDLLVDPTTLTCGHSFCRYCLAKWYGTSNKTECPECRQIWNGFPKVNVHLRTIIEKSYPDEVKVRKKSQLQTGDYNETITKFDSLESSGDRSSATVTAEQMDAMFGLIILVVIVFLVVVLLAFLYYLFLSGPKTNEVIFNKPAEKWTASEVTAWVQEVTTTQSDQDYSQIFSQAKIEGALLLSLTEDDLESPPLNISNALHRKMLATAIKTLNLTRVQQPTNLWEYKRAHRSNALFLLFMVQEYPRLTFAYLHYMEYHTIFLPILHGVMGTEDCETTLNSTICSISNYNPSGDIILKFYLKVILLPYLIVTQFAARFIDVHFLTTWIIISQCAMLSFQELVQLRSLPPLRDIPRNVVSCVVAFILTCVWYWSILACTPSFICDIVFYAKLYYGPIDTAKGIRHGDMHTNIVWQVLNGAVQACRSLWRMFTFFLNRRN